MTSHTGQQIIIIHILPNTSRSKGNHAKKKNWSANNIVREIFFLKIHVGNKVGELAPNLSLFMNKALYRAKASGQHLTFNTFW